MFRHLSGLAAYFPAAGGGPVAIPPMPGALPAGSDINAIRDYYLACIRHIYENRANNGLAIIFNDGVKVGQDSMAMPYTSDSMGRRNAHSWVRAISNFFVDGVGHWALEPVIGTPGQSSCWMRDRNSTQLRIQVSSGGGHQTTVIRTCLWVRVLWFLANPTVNNWNIMNEAGGATGGATPNQFDHYCNRGLSTTNAGNYVCVNAMEHGEVAPVANNNHRQANRCADRSTCAGHPNGTANFCVFTHNDGTPAPCRNNPAGPCPVPCPCATGGGEQC